VFANLYMIGGMLMFGLLVGTIANALTKASASAAQLYRCVCAQELHTTEQLWCAACVHVCVRACVRARACVLQADEALWCVAVGAEVWLGDSQQ
jgi:hypothetical protein